MLQSERLFNFKHQIPISLNLSNISNTNLLMSCGGKTKKKSMIQEKKGRHDLPKKKKRKKHAFDKKNKFKEKRKKTRLRPRKKY